jgi:predicted molibdopterin-dependent oxidoreductase YjgC
MSIAREERRLPRPSSQALTITVDGQLVEAFLGESVATVLLASGRRIFRHTEKSHAPQSLFCGMGICFECLVTIDGMPNVRACTTPVQAGMVIETGGHPGG